MEYTIDAFVDELLLKKRLPEVTPEIMGQLKSDLVSRAEDIINAEILAQMPTDALSSFEEILDKGSDEDIQVFCREHIDNLDEVIAHSLITLSNTYLGTSTN
ncbi:MAG: DUF5663 domain-containing protein [Minisyncoccia bacterium]